MLKAIPTNATVYSIAWPIGMNALLLQAILFIDTVIVGGLGESALAAMGVASAVGGLILGVLGVAQAYGASNSVALKSGFWSGLIVGACVAALGIAFIYLFHEKIIGKLTDDKHVAEMAATYLLISTGVIAGMAICQNISVFLYATDKPKIPFYCNIVELPFNAAVSYALVYGMWGMPQLGIAGAAIGSVLAVMLRMIYLTSFLYRKQFSYLLSADWFENSISHSVIEHLKNALPIAGTFISMNFSFTICMMVYSQLAIHEFAALTILLIWVRTLGQLVTAWCQAIGILVGRLLGQDRAELLDAFVKSAWRLTLIISVFIALIYACTPFLFAYIYPNLESKTLDVVKTLLPILILLPLVRASNTVCGNVLRASGQAGYAFKVHVTAQWLSTVPLTILFVLVLDLPAFWVFALLVFEECLKAVPFHVRIANGRWKQRMAF